jgi:dienelactone hydrolase
MRSGANVVAVALVLTSFTVGTSAGAQEAVGGVGEITETFVDRSRPTAANGDCSRIPSRTLPTTILYPDGDGGPYPLLVFAHGYSAVPQLYEALLGHWAASGFVVAAPTFPLSSATSPCGAIAGDSVNQPEDMSFVIDSVLALSRRDDGPLAGLVDRRKIGAAGHSNGAITTYGLVGNSALRDERVKAAAALAGTLQRFPKGRYDFEGAPPILIVHGTDDALVPYRLGVEAFNRARGPKGLLAIVGGDHGSAAAMSNVAATPQVLAATTDIFRAYLLDDASAKARLPEDQLPGVSTMTFAATRGARTTLPTLPREQLDLKASVKPRRGLVGGQTVTVTWSGYSKGKVVNILQCNGANRRLTNPAACDYSKAKLLQANPTGEGQVELEIIEGTVGDGTCDAEHPGCFIVVNNASSSDPRDSVVVPISFGR